MRRSRNWHAVDAGDAGADDLRRSATASSPSYVLPFELASVVLLAALIGAVVLSRKELKDERMSVGLHPLS